MSEGPRMISRVEYAEQLANKYIQRKPSRMGTVVGDILGVVEVAAMLRCSVDTVRRIPDAALPSRIGPGKCVLYLKEDVLRFVIGLPQYGGFRGAGGHEVKTRRAVEKATGSRRSFDLQDALTQLANLKGRS